MLDWVVAEIISVWKYGNAGTAITLDGKRIGLIFRRSVSKGEKVAVKISYMEHWNNMPKYNVVNEIPYFATKENIKQECNVSYSVAECVYNTLGYQALYLMCSDIDCISLLSINEEDKDILRRYVTLKNDGNKLISFLTPKHSTTLKYIYGSTFMDMLSNHIYEIAIEHSDLVTLKQADAIWQAVGGEIDAEPRVRFILMKSLFSILKDKNSGWIYVYNGEEFTNWMNKAMELSASFSSSMALSYEFLSNHIYYLYEQKQIVLKGQVGCSDFRIGLASYYENERVIAEWVMSLANKEPLYKRKGRTILRDTLEYCENVHGGSGGFVNMNGDMAFDGYQLNAIIQALTNRISIISGGPGRGKTTVASAIAYVWQKMFPKRSVFVTSFTGKATKRIEMSMRHNFPACNMTSGTMHSVFYSRNEHGYLGKHLIIIDELSMISASTLARFLPYCGDDVQVVLLGDVDQLPSIGFGSILRDLIDSKYIVVSNLVTNNRVRGGGRLIAENADFIATGAFGNIKTDDDVFIWNDEYLLPSDMAREIADMYECEVKRFGSMKDVAVLSPYKNDGFIGVIALNQLLQSRMNPNGTDTFVNYFGTYLRIGDRVLMTKNLKDVGIMNGDLGIIVDADYDCVTVRLDTGCDVVITGREECRNLALGYVMTIHKSQGDEYQTVIIALSNGLINLGTRNLLYTAITRAKRKVCLFGSKYVGFSCLEKIEPKRRTWLPELLEEKK